MVAFLPAISTGFVLLNPSACVPLTVPDPAITGRFSQSDPSAIHTVSVVLPFARPVIINWLPERLAETATGLVFDFRVSAAEEGLVTESEPDSPTGTVKLLTGKEIFVEPKNGQRRVEDCCPETLEIIYTELPEER
jgi:hypothetical protein